MLQFLPIDADINPYLQSLLGMLLQTLNTTQVSQIALNINKLRFKYCICSIMYNSIVYIRNDSDFNSMM